MKIKFTKIKIIIGLISLFILFCLFNFWPLDLLRSEILLSSDMLPDGSEIRVTQKWGIDLYTTKVYYHDPERGWGWIIIDPDDSRWWFCKVVFDYKTGNILIYKNGFLLDIRMKKRDFFNGIIYNTSTNTITILKNRWNFNTRYYYGIYEALPPNQKCITGWGASDKIEGVWVDDLFYPIGNLDEVEITKDKQVINKNGKSMVPWDGNPDSPNSPMNCGAPDNLPPSK